MCDHDGYGPTFYREQYYTAKKPHKCSECRKSIAVGEKYRYIAGKWDKLLIFKQCLSCAALMEAITFLSPDTGLCYSGLMQELYDQEIVTREENEDGEIIREAIYDFIVFDEKNIPRFDFINHSDINGVTAAKYYV